MLDSDCWKIPTYNQVNILPPKRLWGGGGLGEDVNLVRNIQGFDLIRTVLFDIFFIVLTYLSECFVTNRLAVKQWHKTQEAKTIVLK